MELLTCVLSRAQPTELCLFCWWGVSQIWLVAMWSHAQKCFTHTFGCSTSSLQNFPSTVLDCFKRNTSKYLYRIRESATMECKPLEIRINTLFIASRVCPQLWRLTPFEAVWLHQSQSKDSHNCNAWERLMLVLPCVYFPVAHCHMAVYARRIAPASTRIGVRCVQSISIHVTCWSSCCFCYCR